MGRALLVPIIIFINLSIFLVWSSADYSRQFMVENFTVSYDGLLSGRPWTLLTSVFSHNLFIHFLINMFVLNSFGSLIEKILGKLKFFTLYIFAGVTGSLGHAFVSAFYLGHPEQAAIGASGAIAGLIFVFALLFPKEKILLLGFIPVPALFGSLAFVALDVWGVMAQADGGGLPIGHGAHLGGVLGGLIYFVLFLNSQNRVETF